MIFLLKNWTSCSLQENLNKKLQMQESSELEKVKQLAQELQDRQFRCVLIVLGKLLHNTQCRVLEVPHSLKFDKISIHTVWPLIFYDEYIYVGCMTCFSCVWRSNGKYLIHLTLNQQ